MFPGGIRNIWINRNFDELNDKVQLRDSLAGKLENAETSLIRNAKKKHTEQLQKEAKSSKNSQSKKDKKRMDDETDAAGVQMANQPGLSSGNPHQPHTVCNPFKQCQLRMGDIFLATFRFEIAISLASAILIV